MDRPEPRERTPAPQSDLAAAAFVVVHDVAASWATYETCGLALRAGAVPGLMLHAAGPTDEGFRTIDVWESDEAYRRHHDVHGDRWPSVLAVPPVVRSLRVLHLISAPNRGTS